jgi:hypothetical protein
MAGLKEVNFPGITLIVIRAKFYILVIRKWQCSQYNKIIILGFGPRALFS